MLFALIFPQAQRASTYDISAERNVWLQSALRSFAIVCDYGNRSLCDRLRSAIRDRLRSFAIIWKPAFNLQRVLRDSKQLCGAYQCQLARNYIQ